MRHPNDMPNPDALQSAARWLRAHMRLGGWRLARDVRFEASWGRIDAELVAEAAADICDARVTERGLEWRLRQEGDA